MIRHSTKVAVETLLGAVVVVTVLLLAFVWRLSEGPISLTPLIPQFAEAFEDRERGLSASMTELVLTWNAQEKRPDLRALGFRLEDEDGQAVVDLPLVSVTLSVGRLLRGQISVSRIDVIGVVLDLVRREDGSFDLNAARPLGSTLSDGLGEGSEVDDLVVTELLRRPEDGGDSPLAALRQIRIIGARMTLTDERSGTVWRAPEAFLTLRRIDQGLSASLDLAVDVAGSLTEIEAEMVFDRDSRQLDSAIDFAGLRPAALYEAIADPALLRLRDFDLNIGGRIVGQMNTKGRLITAAVDLEAGAGSLSLPELGLPLLPVRGIALGAGVDLIEGRVNLRALELLLGEEIGPVLRASGSLSGLSHNIFRQAPQDLKLGVNFSIDSLEVPDLARYWPPPLADDARAWVVENITDGSARDLQGRLELAAPDGDLTQLDMVDLQGGFAYEGLEVHYLRPMPPILGISGEATFGPDSLNLLAEDGESLGISLSSGAVDITGFKDEDQYITIESRASGAVADILGLLDHERLGLISRLGLSRKGAAGNAEGQLYFNFPLIKDLTLEEVDLRAQADVTGGALEQVVLGQSLTKGNLKLDVTMRELGLTGDGEFGAVPMSFVWREFFEGEGGLRRTVEGTVPAIEADEILALGLDVRDYLEGPVAGDFSYSERLDDRSDLALDMDLEAASLRVPVMLGWNKPAGTSGRGSLTLVMQDYRPVSLSGIDVRAGSLSLTGEAQFNEAGDEVASAAFETLAFGDQSLWGVRLNRRGERFELAAAGGILDVSPFMELDQEGQEPAPEPAPEAPTGGGQDEIDDSQFRISVENLEQVRFAPGRYLEAATLDLERLADGWRRVLVTGRIPEALRSETATGQSIEIDYGPGAGGGQVLSVRSGDAGGLFRAVNLLDTMQGGRLSIEGRRSDRSWSTPLEGSLLIEEFKLIEAPVLARILTLASLTGILNVLGGEGITFQEITGDFTAERGKLSTELMRAYGPAIGLTAEGFIDLDADEAQLSGTVVPAYSVNRVLGAIPLLGAILTGGEGEGVFAVTYGVSGPLENLDVSVNPLSVLAPGFLRNLFSLPEGDQEALDPDFGAPPRGADRD